ncbi:hypothetical protein [Ferrimonas balearica]|uniref:hypothetical protein n=1 Tax=Ferrimonas balearica TaxID=44012 RepID=UPI001C980C20|nr:hypothetical protein [Ferrimonas balearica]MBY6223553.1 hypothetical protein [Ferrimonas balearica]
MDAFLSPRMQQWLRRPNVSLVLMADLDFASGPVRCHSGAGDALWQGKTFKGIGVLGKVGPVKQGTQVQPYRLRLTLSGLPQDLVAVALGEHYQNRPGALYLAAVEHSQVIEADLLFAGRMDVMTLQMGDTATLQLDLNSRGVDWKNARNRRYTDADQQAEHPGDKFFEFVPQMAEKAIFWGVPGQPVGGGGGGGGRAGRPRQHK